MARVDYGSTRRALRMHRARFACRCDEARLEGVQSHVTRGDAKMRPGWACCPLPWPTLATLSRRHTNSDERIKALRLIAPIHSSRLATRACKREHLGAPWAVEQANRGQQSPSELSACPLHSGGTDFRALCFNILRFAFHVRSVGAALCDLLCTLPFNVLMVNVLRNTCDSLRVAL